VKAIFGTKGVPMRHFVSPATDAATMAKTLASYKVKPEEGSFRRDRRRPRRYCDCCGGGAILASSGPVFSAGFIHRTVPRKVSEPLPARESVIV